MNPSDLPEVTTVRRRTWRPWLTALGTDETADYNEDDSIPAHVKEQRGSNEPPLERAMSARTGLSRGESFDGGTQGSERSSRLMRSHAMQSVHLIMQPTMADKFLGPATSGHDTHRETVPRFIIHPLDFRYRLWWYTTVLVAAITSILEPYAIAFTPPGLYPYGSATSILEYICMVLIAIDMCVSFNVARYERGVLVTDRWKLAKNYGRLLFFVDLISVFPFDEIALAIAGLNGSQYVNNPVLAQYLSLFKLLRMLRIYRLSWFFAYLTYNLAAPLLLVTITRNLYLTFFSANIAACAWYFEARQRGFAEYTWAGAPGTSFNTSASWQMYLWSLYWSMMTLATIGYGDIRAYNTVEAVLAIIWTLFSFFFSAYIIGSITLLVVKNDERAGRYRDHMQILQRFSAAHDLPTPIRESMLRHLKLYLRNENASDEVVLAKYPSAIRRQVLQFLYMPAMQEAYLFVGAKPRFLDALLAAARVELYLPNVEILSRGDFVNDLFIVVGGEVIEKYNDGKGMVSTDENTVHGDSSGGDVEIGSSSVGDDDTEAIGNKSEQILVEGDVFGEVAFFTGTAQFKSVTSRTTVRVLAISRMAYEQVTATFKSSARRVLTHLALHAEEIAMDYFPGPRGLATFQKAMAAQEAAVEGLADITGGDPTWHLPPGAVRSLRISAGQEAAIGNYARVKLVVAQRVKKHDEDMVSEWLNAASRGEVDKLEEFMHHRFDVNATDYDGRTALMIAARRGHEDAIALLLRHGAKPNIMDGAKRTALWEACCGGHDAAIALLRDHGGTLGRTGAEEGAVLCNAVAEGDLKLLGRLLRAGADANARDYDDRTALHIASSEGNVAAVEILIAEGHADPSVRDRWGLTPLEEASRVGSRAVVMFLEAELSAREDEKQKDV